MNRFLSALSTMLLVWSFCTGAANAELSKGQAGNPKRLVASHMPSSKAELTCSSDACVLLMEGKELFDRGKYSEAAEKFGKAYKELPVIGDYVLFLIAKAYAKNGDIEESDKHLDELLASYPDSTVKKRARALKIKNTLSTLDDAKKEGTLAAMRSLERYVADYPEDIEMKFLLGQMVKAQGETDRAQGIFKQIYITNSSFSETAGRELQPSAITAADMLAKASNLIKDAEYRKAESLLKKGITLAGGSTKTDMQQKIGVALFGQKRYREAAFEFAKAGDTYNNARSLYRSGDIDAFSAAVSKLLSMEDRRAGSLLIALAAKKRREGNLEEALSIYRDVRKRYPSQAEDALWGTAWAFYRTGDYKSALSALNDLSAVYPDARYLYWKARSIENGVDENPAEKEGVAAETIYGQIREKGKDFYSFLVVMRDKESAGAAGMSVEFRRIPDYCPAASGSKGGERQTSLQKSEVFARTLERFLLLTALGMKEDALSELLKASRNASSPEAVLSLCHALKEAGAYKNAISLVSRLTKRPDPQEKFEVDITDVLYPMAHWTVVEDVAKGVNLDPLILLSVMREESRFDPEARSIAGAIGLMQVMPQTADILGRSRLKLSGSELKDIKTNITLGASYLASLIKEFRSLPVAIAAYNAGEERVRAWIKQGAYRSDDEFIEDIPYDETRNYVKKVLFAYSVYRQKAMTSPSACGSQETK